MRGTSRPVTKLVPRGKLEKKMALEFCLNVKTSDIVLGQERTLDSRRGGGGKGEDRG